MTGAADRPCLTGNSSAAATPNAAKATPVRLALLISGSSTASRAPDARGLYLCARRPPRPARCGRVPARQGTRSRVHRAVLPQRGARSRRPRTPQGDRRAARPGLELTPAEKGAAAQPMLPRPPRLPARAVGIRADRPRPVALARHRHARPPQPVRLSRDARGGDGSR